MYEIVDDASLTKAAVDEVTHIHGLDPVGLPAVQTLRGRSAIRARRSTVPQLMARDAHGQCVQSRGEEQDGGVVYGGGGIERLDLRLASVHARQAQHRRLPRTHIIEP